MYERIKMNLLTLIIIIILAKMNHGFPWYIWLVIGFCWIIDAYEDAAVYNGINHVNQNIRVLGNWLGNKLSNEQEEEEENIKE